MVTNETIYLDEAEVTAGTQPYMKTLKDIQYAPDSMFCSFVKLLGSPIVDAKISFSREWGGTLVHVYSLILEDGRNICLQGEHDIVYLDYDVETPEQLDLFYEEENGEL